MYVLITVNHFARNILSAWHYVAGYEANTRAAGIYTQFAIEMIHVYDGSHHCQIGESNVMVLIGATAVNRIQAGIYDEHFRDQSLNFPSAGSHHAERRPDATLERNLTGGMSTQCIYQASFATTDISDVKRRSAGVFQWCSNPGVNTFECTCSRYR